MKCVHMCIHVCTYIYIYIYIYLRLCLPSQVVTPLRLEDGSAALAQQQKQYHYTFNTRSTHTNPNNHTNSTHISKLAITKSLRTAPPCS